MNRIEYNSQDEGENSDSELEELFNRKTELRQKRGPNKPKPPIEELKTDSIIMPMPPPPPSKKERSDAQKQATAKMREKLKNRHDELQKIRIETQEIVKLQHKEISLNVKKKLFKDNVNEQIELRVQERLNEIRLKAEADAPKVKPKRIRKPPAPKPKPEPKIELPPPPPQQEYRHQSAPHQRPIQMQRKALSFV